MLLLHQQPESEREYSRSCCFSLGGYSRWHSFSLSLPLGCWSGTPGTAKGDDCVFPFIYRGNSYSSCVSFRFLGIKLDTMWCSTTRNYDIDKKWKICLDYGMVN
uniref:Fibronectin type-II domain-containing protein n=1 Tax=Astyanax mexicanus TaxID=7994 RepID=A0A3B1IEG3_ASTMX